MPSRDMSSLLLLAAAAPLTVLSLQVPQPLPPQPTQPATTTSRRHACGLAASLLLGAAAPAQPAHAFFESPAQLAVTSVADTQPKLRDLAREVAEVKRKRAKMTVDKEDDAYVIRFARSILDPAAASMVEAAPALPASAAALPTEFKEQLGALYTACRAYEAGDELDALEKADRALTQFLEIAASAKFDVQPKGQVNGWSGGTGILYNPFLFRAG